MLNVYKFCVILMFIIEKHAYTQHFGCILIFKNVVERGRGLHYVFMYGNTLYVQPLLQTNSVDVHETG